ncbi:N5-carboxyaminoimidazole ribonucleotide synthase [Bosea thiooxidans]
MPAPGPNKKTDPFRGRFVRIVEISGRAGRCPLRLSAKLAPAWSAVRVRSHPSVATSSASAPRRGIDGAFAAFDVCENEHRDHILAFTHVPANLPAAAADAAIDAARQIGEALGYVGVFAVEMFVLEGKSGTNARIVINEIAPRVHNSGHWTSEGALTSQFHQHVRAVCGFPLGATARRGRIEMENLIGDAALRWREILAEPGAHLHLYGKRDARPGRKMGHVTRLVGEDK